MGIQFLLALFLTLGEAHANEAIVVKKLVTPEELKAEYCRIETLSSIGDNCGRPSDVVAVDVVYLPLSLAEKIAGHVRSAYQKNYYFNLNKEDFFHGHLLARGPQMVYASPAEYFADVRLILYHSQEYINTWESIEGFDPFVPHQNQRSFVGRFAEDLEVIPAIDLIDRSLYPPPYTMGTLRGYRNVGTIYMSDLNKSVQESLHDYNETHLNFYIQSGKNPGETCEIFQQIYLLEDAKGRFESPDGKKYDITLHCRYRRNL